MERKLLNLLLHMTNNFFKLIFIITLFIRCSDSKKSKEQIEEQNAVQEKSEEFIYYGEKTKKDEIPWQVALFIKDSLPSKTAFCGGIIIDKKWIVTAAHCFQYMEDDTLRIKSIGETQVLSGTNNLDSIGIISDIKKLHIPEDYEPSNVINDIAILELTKELDLSESNQSKIFAPTYEEYLEFTKEGAMMTVSGWGETDTADRPVNLMKMQVPIANNQTCIDNYFDVNRIVNKDMICAGYDQDSPDSCQGDSGGPMFAKTQKGDPILLGVVSWGEGCAENGYYGVYTNFYNYIDWIGQYCGECVQNELDTSLSSNFSSKKFSLKR